MNDIDIKKVLFATCEKQLLEKYNIVQEKMKSIALSLNSATKSSAGDKHETTRAMLQLEREQAGERLVEIEKTQELLYKITLKNTSQNAYLGSLVTTNQGVFFLSISIGRVSIENNDYFCIGLQTPIGKLLLGKKQGDSFEFRDKFYTISTIT